MKAYEIIDAGFSLAGENYDDYPDKKLPLAWLNVAMAECMAAENLFREKTGKPLLENCPDIAETAEEIDFSRRICRVCLPLGIASCLCDDRENDYMGKEFRKRFESALKASVTGIELPIEDFYTGGGNL